MSLKKQLFAHFKSMRPYLFLFSGMAATLGILFSGKDIPFFRAAIIVCIASFGWGVNQVINDLLGLTEDKINAPHRPIVTRELPAFSAILISFSLFFVGFIFSFYLNPLSLALYIFVFVLNIVYAYSKRIPLLGNIVFGMLLPPCVYYGAMCINGKGLEILLDKTLLPLANAIFLVSAVVCYFTYYKDYKGDKYSGNRTLVVLLRPESARYLNFFLSALPFSVIIAMEQANLIFYIYMFMVFVMFQYASFIFYRCPRGEKTYYSLRWVFTAGVLFETSFIALLNPFLAGIILLGVFMIINLLFSLARDPLA